MTVVIRIERAQTVGGVTTHRVRLRSGTIIGRIDQTAADAFTARTGGDTLVGCGGTAGFSTLTDAAACLWLAFMAGRPEPTFI